ncbi:MAG: response regulator transcription factor [Oscillospiraceae bacterium]|nr:response regulator transcription factor [Oscillospiraceae bacterium]
MIRVAVVEDDSAERARLCSCLRWLEESEGYSFSVTEFLTGTAFIGNYSNDYDLVFMDIEMPGMNGMETARVLRKMDPTVLLIFVTNMTQYAIAGYEVDALDYILKPVNRYSFAIKMRRAVSRVPKRAEEYIPVKCDGEIRQLEISAIRYLDIDGHYVVYHTADGDIEEYGTLKEAYGKLNRSYFVFVNRSCLVNLYHVTSVSKTEAKIGEKKLDISRPQRKAFLAAMSDFMGGRR